MDADRYKKGDNKPKKRSVNSDDSPSSLQPRLFKNKPNKLQPEPAKPVTGVSASKTLKSLKGAFSDNKNANKIELHKPKIIEPTPILFDKDDEDIFGVWKKQKDIKKARQAEEAKAKAAKKAAKILKKQRKQSANNGSKTEIAISVTIPKVSKPKIPSKIPGYNPLYKKYYIGVGALLVLPLCFMLVASFTHVAKNSESTKKPEVQGKTVAAKPDFNTLKPTTSDNQATETKYDATKKVASYNDVLKDVPITVSQQPLPAKFVKDPTGEIANLAKEINANDKISTSDATAYAGISIKGPQTVVFTKNDLLVFILADKKIDQLAWADYIEKMQ